MVITITINPAMDKVMTLDKFRLNVTNRIQSQFTCVGGKGTHVSINLALMGIRSIAAGVVMGPTGDEILEQLANYNIDVRFIKADKGNSRTNYILVDSEGNCTLLSEKGQMMEQDTIDRFVRHCFDLVGEGDTLVISGDASNQRDTTLQDTLINIALTRRARFCLDASGEHLTAGIKKRPFLVKPNLDELGYLIGKAMTTDEDIIAAVKQVHEAGAENIVASCGSMGSYAFLEGKLYRANAPEVEVKNTVGCGDALLSGILAGLEMKLPAAENLRKATAVAAATAMNISTVGFDCEIAQRLENEIIVEEIPF